MHHLVSSRYDWCPLHVLFERRPVMGRDAAIAPPKAPLSPSRSINVLPSPSLTQPPTIDCNGFLPLVEHAVLAARGEGMLKMYLITAFHREMGCAVHT